jgi:hypothetical protein
VQHYRHTDTPGRIPRDLYGIPTFPATTEVPQPAPARMPQLARQPQPNTDTAARAAETASVRGAGVLRRGPRKPHTRVLLGVASGAALVALVPILLVALGIW